MARKRKTYRRRRGRFSFLLKFLCFVLIFAALVGALTTFFKVDCIKISGNEKYQEEEILVTSGIKTGDNLILMNKYAVAQMLFEKLPYVESASIRRSLPDTLLIDVKECCAVASVPSETGECLISVQGKILEQTSDVPQGCIAVSGALLAEPQLSTTAAFSTEESYKCDALLKLLAAAEEKLILENIETVDLSDGTCLQFTYLGRFFVKVPWDCDIAYKLESLCTVVDYLEDNETGTINLLTEGKASFIPK